MRIQSGNLELGQIRLHRNGKATVSTDRVVKPAYLASILGAAGLLILLAIWLAHASEESGSAKPSSLSESATHSSSKSSGAADSCHELMPGESVARAALSPSAISIDFGGVLVADLKAKCDSSTVRVLLRKSKDKIVIEKLIPPNDDR